MNVTHFEKMFDGIVPHDSFRVKEVCDGGVGDAQLAVGLRQTPLSTREENFALSSEIYFSKFVNSNTKLNRSPTE